MSNQSQQFDQVKSGTDSLIGWAGFHVVLNGWGTLAPNNGVCSLLVFLVLFQKIIVLLGCNAPYFKLNEIIPDCQQWWRGDYWETEFVQLHYEHKLAGVWNSLCNIFSSFGCRLGKHIGSILSWYNVVNMVFDFLTLPFLG
jgi:hypothetical protein